jgi:hypothetical protein
MTLSYEELANALEEGWSVIGLHEHDVAEQVNPTTLERSFRAELFPEHGDPLTEHNTPPWVEVSFVWGPSHQIHTGTLVTIPLELTWEYTITVPPADKRNDSELIRTLQSAIQSALRKVFHEEVGHDVLVLEVRRAYKAPEARELRCLEIHARGSSDISDVLGGHGHDHVQTVIQEEYAMVNVLLQTFADTFSPGSVGWYRSVESA